MIGLIVVFGGMLVAALYPFFIGWSHLRPNTVAMIDVERLSVSLEAFSKERIDFDCPHIDPSEIGSRLEYLVGPH